LICKKSHFRYYKQKGYVKEVIDKYTAVVVLLSSGAKLKLDQTHLETVIPGLGKQVLILKGPYRGEEASLKELDIKNFSGVLEISSGSQKGEIISLAYEYFSKLHIPEA
jgi:DNA/RNA-binding protein KIN17